MTDSNLFVTFASVVDDNGRHSAVIGTEGKLQRVKITFNLKNGATGPTGSDRIWKVFLHRHGTSHVDDDLAVTEETITTEPSLSPQVGTLRPATGVNADNSGSVEFTVLSTFSVTLWNASGQTSNATMEAKKDILDLN